MSGTEHFIENRVNIAGRRDRDARPRHRRLRQLGFEFIRSQLELELGRLRLGRQLLILIGGGADLREYRELSAARRRR